MTVEGRTQKPVINHGKCQPCSVCLRECPAEIMPEMRNEKDSLRGKAYKRGWTGIEGGLTPKKDLPPCQERCPLHQDIRGYLKLVSERSFSEALTLIRETNPLPSVCGYVCHRPCEAACLQSKIDAPPPIRLVKRFVTDSQKREIVNAVKHTKRSSRISIIGSGPAGLTAAYDLAIKGYLVEIIESHSQPGGMLSWAIPDFRLPGDVLARDIEFIKELGVVIKTDTEFGVDLTLADLENSGSEVVIVAVGTMADGRMNIKNERTCGGYINSLTFLRNQGFQKSSLGDTVLVIGGGNAAVDTARVAARLGPKKVRIIYRRGREEMPADRHEVDQALQEGIDIEFLTEPVELLIGNNRVKGLKCVKTELIDDPPLNRRKPVAIPGSEFEILAGTIISAVGQFPDFMSISKGLPIDPDWKSLAPFNDESAIVKLPHVFVTGDFVNGSSSVVEAMASGRRTANAVDLYLNSKSTKKGIPKR